MKTKNKIFIRRAFNCSAKELFKWLVDPVLIVLWFGPKHLSTVSAQNDLKIGGKYSILLESSRGSFFSIEGEYLEIEPPRRLCFTFRYQGRPDPPPESTVEINIAIKGPRSQLTLIQYFDTEPLDLPGRKDSWEHMLHILDSKINVESN